MLKLKNIKFSLKLKISYLCKGDYLWKLWDSKICDIQQLNQSCHHSRLSSLNPQTSNQSH